MHVCPYPTLHVCPSLQVAKQSKAAQSMCLWVRAMDTYARTFRVVEPKRQSLAAAQAALDDMNARLAAKRGQLDDINRKVGSSLTQLSPLRGISWRQYSYGSAVRRGCMGTLHGHPAWPPCMLQ